MRDGGGRLPPPVAPIVRVSRAVAPVWRSLW